MEFTFVGGSVGLDLLATVRDWEGAADDLLTTPDLFAAWAMEANLVSSPPAVPSVDLDEVRRFRHLGYRLIKAASSGAPLAAADRRQLNGLAARAPITYTLDASGQVNAAGGFEQIASTIARDFVTILGSPALAHLRQCDGDHCSRFFIDASRAHTRRFCSDRICGNRAKVAAYRRRASQAATQ